MHLAIHFFAHLLVVLIEKAVHGLDAQDVVATIVIATLVTVCAMATRVKSRREAWVLVVDLGLGRCPCCCLLRRSLHLKLWG